MRTVGILGSVERLRSENLAEDLRQLMKVDGRGEEGDEVGTLRMGEGELLGVAEEMLADVDWARGLSVMHTGEGIGREEKKR